jgi:nicotinamidase/pyrazinamidase
VFHTRDWHPANHCSFQANHPGTELFSIIVLPDSRVEQVMWPTHCVQNTHGAEFHAECLPREAEIVVDKGTDQSVESYAGFGSHPELTTLKSLLDERNVKTIYCVGLAYDYCMGDTAADGAKLGYETYLVRDATRSVAEPSEKAMCQKLADAGVKEILSEQLV